MLKVSWNPKDDNEGNKDEAIEPGQTDDDESSDSSNEYIDESQSDESEESNEDGNDESNEDGNNEGDESSGTDEGQDSALLNRLFPVLKAYAASDISDLEKSDEKSKELFKGFLYHCHECNGT